MENSETQKRLSNHKSSVFKNNSKKNFALLQFYFLLFFLTFSFFFFSSDVIKNSNYFSTIPPEDNIKTSQCKTISSPANKKSLVNWDPEPNKYLFMMCSGGQLSNRLICIRHSILDAILLKRKLIFPSTGINYDYSKYLDFGALRNCFGDNIILYKDFVSQNNGEIKIKKNFCFIHIDERMEATKRNKTITVCESIMEKYKQKLKVEFKEYEKIERGKEKWERIKVGEFKDRFGEKEKEKDIISFSNMFGVGGEDITPFFGNFPINVSENCRSFLQPSIPIRETAKSFVNWLLGTHYIAIHFRSGDFFLHCLQGLPWQRPYPCWHPLTQIATCIIQRLKSHSHIKVVYLATNAKWIEVEYLQKIVNAQVPGLVMLRLPSPRRQEWARPLERSKLSRDMIAISLLEKMICVYSAVFIGSSRSTFSEDITLLRQSYGLHNSCDDIICPLYQPADVIALRQN